MASARHTTRAFYGLALAALAAITSFASLGCEEGRFPTCKDNEECAKQTDGGAPVCFDLRCVQCHYDGDCPSGKLCDTQKAACQSVDDRQHTEEPAGDAGVEATRWEPGSWDDCARDCKDPECIKACDAKFPKSAAAAKDKKDKAAAKKPAPK